MDPIFPAAGSFTHGRAEQGLDAVRYAHPGVVRGCGVPAIHMCLPLEQLGLLGGPQDSWGQKGLAAVWPSLLGPVLGV